MTTHSAQRSRYVVLVLGLVFAILAFAVASSAVFSDTLNLISESLFAAAALAHLLAFRDSHWCRWAAVAGTTALVSRGLVNLAGAPVDLDNWALTVRIIIWLYSAWVTWLLWTRWLIPLRKLADGNITFTRE